MIMSDYDTLSLTYRDTTVTPITQKHARRSPSLPHASISEFIDGLHVGRQLWVTPLLHDYSRKGVEEKKTRN